MSSYIRNIQRALKRGKFYKGRGSQLGVKNPKVKPRINSSATIKHDEKVVL